VSLRRRNQVWSGVTTIASFCLDPISAHAHLVQTGLGTFYDGLAHLMLTPADLVVVLGLGLLAGSCGEAASRGVLLTLPGTWLVGGLVGFSFPSAHSPPWATTISCGHARAERDRDWVELAI
jgi:hydrogenase/urease accessory protein HupE